MNTVKGISISLGLVAASLAISVSAQAMPTFDPVLQQLMARQDNRRVKVVAFFRSKRPMPQQARFMPGSRLQMQRAMQQDASESQRDTIDRLRRTQGVSQIRAQQLWLVNAMVLELPASQLSLLASDGAIRHVSSDYELSLIRPVAGRAVSRAELNREDAFTYGLQKMSIPELRQTFPNLDGTGIRVGVIDTGIDANHPDLKGRVVAFKDFTDRPKNEPYDDNGHGTHCAGTIGGGAVSGTSIGVAPNAQFVVAKFLTGSGSGTFAGALASMQYMADPDGNPSTNDAPMIVSNSWGGGAPSASKDPKDEPMCEAINGWVKLGILPVFAAGNSGPRAPSVGLPGGCPGALTIGATDANDQIANFSSRGPAVWSTGKFVKPDVTAPGVKVLSSVPGGAYKEFSGTSMATPHVAGMAALLYQAQPQMPVDRMIALIRQSVVRLGQDPNTFGTGRVDALKAVKAISSSQRR